VLTVGSLFSGIGGLDLGLERAGMNVIWQSEIDPYGCRVLKKHWPEVVNHGNIKEINWGDIVRPDVICGGYPCQPFSTAGKRNGTDDPRHLWPWVREAISELRPKYAILENVRGHVSLGLDIVLREMASIGYDAEWQIVSAASVGAPHRRDRVIIVAYPTEQFSNERGHGDNPGKITERQALQEQIGRGDSAGTNTIGKLANPDISGRLHGQSQIFTTDRWLNALSLIGASSTNVADSTQQSSDGEPDNARNSARSETFSQSGNSGGTQNVADSDSGDTPNGRQRQGIQSQDSSRGNDRSGSRSDTGQVSVGSTRQDSSDMANTNAWETSRGVRSVSTDTGQVREQRNHARGKENHASRQWWATEPDVGRVAHGVSSRVDRLRGLGNAVVPQVAELIGRMVIDYDTNL
jgi:DNA (cytosine-5)-methyltransferase 1